MSKYLYKQYVRLVAKWPKDEFKSPPRDLAVFLSGEVERHFKTDSSGLDIGLCERRYRVETQKCISAVVSNPDPRMTQRHYPLNSDPLAGSSIAGVLETHELEANTDENRRHFGLGREGLLKRLWKAVFPPSPAKDNASG
ncbi:unnamed protein product [Heligmosomoides polygyrus]|uniref:Mitochondrial protein M19 n=1 Tax=Heligmosomoides polygyrus TaxID=6339 RepID=A0A183G9N5_HELPZ|nr:unnamed protein product [Heligmosomoides polygyrus]